MTNLIIELLVCLTLSILSYTYLKKRYLNSSNLIIYMIIMVILLTSFILLKNILYNDSALINILKITSLMSMLFVLAYTDIKEKIIPNNILIFYAILRLVYIVFELISNKSYAFKSLKTMLILSIVVAIMFFFISAISKSGIGMGDIKMILVICLYTGYYDLVNTIFYSLIIACIISVYMIVIKKKTKKDTLPLAPSFLIGLISYYMIHLNLH